MSFSFLFRWGPVVAWMIGIFIFSGVSNPLGPLSKYSWAGMSAHVLEYTGLGAVLYNAFNGDRPWTQTAWRAMAVAVAYGFLDELHQSFVPHWEFSLIDLGLDTLGAAIGVAVIAALVGRKEKPVVE